MLVPLSMTFSLWILLLLTPVNGFCSRVGARLALAVATEQAHWEEIATSNSDPPSTDLSVGEKIKQGESIVLLSDLVSPQECALLVDSCARIAEQTTPTELEKRGLVRLPTIAAAQRAAKSKLLVPILFLKMWIDY